MPVKERMSEARSPGPQGNRTVPPDKLKIFISYSRADTPFADEIVAGLEFDGGFDVMIDRHDIHEGEEWKSRLGALIAAADTIVFILSQRSAASPICRWEVDHAKHLSKRIIPVQAEALGGTAAPDALAALNYVRFDEGRSFMAGLTGLRRALKTDIDWLREHTRLLTRAQEWDAANRVDNRLLSGKDILDAKAWVNRSPAEGLQPTELHRDFIRASEEAETLRLSAERERAESLQRAVKRTRIALFCAVVLALVAGGASVIALKKEQEASAAQNAERQARTQLEDQVAELAAANLRLEAGMGMQLKPLKQDVEIDKNWLRSANRIASSVAFVQSEGRTLCTGFVADGAALSAAWRGKTVLITTSYCLGTDEMALPVETARIVFPSSSQTTSFGLARLLWESPQDEQGISIVQVDEELPRTVKRVDKIELQITNLQIVDQWPAGLNPSSVPTDATQIALIGSPRGKDVAILITHLLGRSPEGEILYQHITSPGVGGAPVFDLKTGVVLGLHFSGSNPFNVKDGFIGLAMGKTFAGLPEAISASRP